MNITFPDNCTDSKDRLEWCYKAKNRLKLIHNGMDKWHRESLSLNAYKQFPNKIKNRYPYASQLSSADWTDFVENVFFEVSAAIGKELLMYRELAKTSNQDVDLDRDVN